MKSILILLTASLSFSIYGQTTITSNDFIVAGDSIGISSTTNLTIDYSTTGSNSIWDFSNLTENNQFFEIAYSLSGAGAIINFQFGSFASSKYKASFYQPFDGLPIAQLGDFLTVNIEAINRMIKVENDKVTYPGYSLKVNGQQVGFKSDTIEKAYVFPLNYGDSYTSRGYTNIDLNPIYNAKIIQYRQRVSNVDGEGQLITPFGTYNVLRIHHKITEQDSMRIPIGPINQTIPINRTANEYEWWDTGLKRPVLKIETEEVLGIETPTRITFLNNQTVDLKQNTIELALYPNPTNDFITIKSLENIQTVLIYSLDGKQVLSKSADSKELILDLQHLSPGMYTLQTVTKNGHSFNPIVIK